MSNNSEQIFVGRKPNGEKVYVSARFDHPADRPSGNPWRETVDHVKTTERLRLSIQGVEVAWNGSIDRDGTWASCGQTREGLLELAELAPGWTIADVVKLHEIWRDYHLNDMNALCAHQVHGLLPGDCPESGYTAGSKWLYKPLPYHVVAWVTERFGIELPEPGRDTDDRYAPIGGQAATDEYNARRSGA